MRKKIGRRYKLRYEHHFKLRSKIREHNKGRVKNVFKIFLISVAVAAVMVFAVGKLYRFLTLSDTFRLKEIKVEGLETVTESAFRENLGITLKDSLMSTYFRKIGGGIKSLYPQIKAVNIHRSLPDRIKFTVTEREPVAWTKSGGSILFVDDENVYFKVNRSTSGLPQMDADSPGVSGNELALLEGIRNNSAELYSRIVKLYNVKESFMLLLKDNLEVLWGGYSRESLNLKCEYLLGTMEYALQSFKPIEYVNLELFNEGRIVVRPVALKGKTKARVKKENRARKNADAPRRITR